MHLFKIVIDTNVIIAALKSNKGASYKLISLIDKKKFEYILSVPLFFEYEEAAVRQAFESGISDKAVNAILDRLCYFADIREVFFLWRPFLPDPDDEMVLDVAVESNCDFIISYNKRDFVNIDKFGIKVLTPKEFLENIGEIS